MNNLVIAIPSKGRLKERSEAVLSAAGFTIEAPENARSYFGKLKGMKTAGNVDIAFMSASEISREIMAGSIHLGLTGEDLVRETAYNWDDKIELLHPLGFGKADVVIAVPESWVDVQSVEDLNDVASNFRKLHGRRLRVATKYWMLTRKFFAQTDLGAYRIVESLGATEGTPASGTADIIVDITSTGASLEANHLKVLQGGTILHSEANLIGSKTAVWDDDLMAIKDEIVSRIAFSLIR